MSTISAGTTLTTSLVNTGDTTGQLVFQTNGTTTALTLGTDQSATFAGNVVVNGSIAVPSPFAVTGNSTAGAEIRLPEDTDNGSNYVALKAPNSLASNLTLTLPSADGTSGQVLQTNGSGTLSFATPATGALVLLSSQSISSATTYVTFSNVFSATYDNYMVIFDQVAFNNSYAYSGGVLQAQLQRSGTFATTGYTGQYGNIWASATNALDIAGSVATAARQNSGSSSGVINLYAVNSSSNQKINGFANGLEGCFFNGNVAAATTGIRFLVESTNTTIVQGNFYVYGIAKV